MTEKQKRLLWHIPHGMGISVGVLGNPTLGLSWLALCIVYQVVEDWRIGDNSYLDTRGYLVGMPLGVILWPMLSRLAEWWLSI